MTAIVANKKTGIRNMKENLWEEGTMSFSHSL